jgi:tRNA modification GTPase
MLSLQQDPIVAITTAPGRGAVGIVRVSGPSVAAIVAAVCGGPLKPREATYRSFLAADGSVLDRGLAIHFVAPNSYTGEEVLELQAHGGSVVLQLLLARCIEAGQTHNPATGNPWLAGIRAAQPGEFTRRAFLNNKMDLAQAEAVADLIDASTETAARSASRSLMGAFSNEINTLRDRLIQLRMLVEATLDFPEEDIDFLSSTDAHSQLLKLQQTLSEISQRTRQGAILREGITVVIAGQPNAGKSSLLNALAGAELAIVTPIPGTTRDKVEQTIQMDGVPVHVIDTAGLRESQDEVEKIGIARAWDAIGAADAVVFLHDLTQADAPDSMAADAAIARTLSEKLSGTRPILDIWNKADIASRRPAAVNLTNETCIHLSAKTGEGLALLRNRLLHIAGWQPGGESVYMARTRHVQALQLVGEHFTQANLHMRRDYLAMDLLAEDLRLAQNALNDITGAFSSDDLLGVIFSSFCIGK